MFLLVRIVGKILTGFLFVTSIFSSLFAVAHQSSHAFGSFHWPIIAMFLLELIIWEFGETLI